MFNVSRFSRGGVSSRLFGITILIAILFVAGCTTSNSVTIGPPAKLAFATQPGSVAAGSGSITVAVSIEDSAGHVVTTATNQVTIAIGTNPSGGTLTGTAMATAVAGVATFSNLSINNVGTGYTLAASATGLTGATSSAFNVVGPPTKLAFTVQPSNVAAGSSIAPAITVSIEDAAGNVVPTATNQVTIAIGTNPTGGTLSGTALANAVAGVATFSTLSVNKVGTGYTLTASATGLTAATSSAFNVTVGAAAKLVFTVQPTNTTAGTAINPAVQVTIEDSQGNVVTTATNTITIGAGSVAVVGTTAVAAVSGVATFSNLNINVAGTGYTLTASGTGLTGATSSAFNVTVGAAAKLVFTGEPSNVAAGTSINPAVTVSIEDAAGNVVPTATNQVALAIATNPSSGTLSGTAVANAVAGVATFSNLSINKVGTGYTLAAGATGLTGANSTAFNVTAGTASQLVFTTEPTSVTAGSSITPAVKVSIEDALGNVVTSATNQVTISLGPNPSTGTLSGTLQASAVAGVATFSNLSINVAANGYTLLANASSLSSGFSNAFNVTAGAASKLAFTTQPTNTTAGVTISPAVQVTIEDNQGNTVTTATTQITVAVGTNPSSGTLSGTTQVNAAAGVATFSTLSINSAGNGYTLGATASGLTPTTSSAFNINAGAATKLAFTAQPVNTVAASTITPSVTVSVEDALGNVVTTATNQITVAIGTNPSSGTLSGTLVVNAVNGVATFSTLNINNVGTGYTLTASAAGLTGATSTAFNVIVSVGPPAKLAFTVQPSNVVAGVSISPAVQVTIEDSNGNQVTSATNQVTITIATNPSSGTLSGTLTANAVSGVATFSTLSINKAGTGYALGASASGLTGATSGTFNVTAASAAKLAFTVQPSNVASQISITPAVAVSVEDSLGNVIASATNLITVAILNNPSGGTLGGTPAVNAASGVATFSNLTIDKAGTGYTLSATASSLTSATSSPFNVTAGAAAKLAFTVQPSNVAAGSSITPAVQVSIEDFQSNLVTSATNQITVAIQNNPSGGTLGGTLAVNAVSGVATFSNLTINNMGNGYTLNAIASGLTSTVSNSFNVTSADPCATAGTGSESLLSGHYALLLKGFDNGTTGTETAPEPALVGGVLTFNGTNNNGLITAGAIDMNLDAGMQSNLAVTAGTYKVGSDQRVCMTITTSAGTQHYRGSLGNISGSPSVASTGHIIGFDTAGPFTTGVLRKQSSTIPTTLSGNFAFGVSSIQNTASTNGNGGLGGSFGAAGILTLASNGTLTSGSVDFNQNGFLDNNSVVGGNWPTSPTSIDSGSYSIAANGRGTFNFTPHLANLVHTVIYVVSSSEILILNSDAQASNSAFAGSALLQSGTPFSANPLSGAYVGYQSGMGSTTGTSRATLLLLTASGTGISGTQLRNDGGSFQSKSLSGITYSVAGSGRMTVTGGTNPPIFYLVSASQAFVLSSDTTVDTGFFQSQSGGPFSNSSASGTYAFGTLDPQVSNQDDNSGVALFASPSVTVTEDDNGNGFQKSDQTQIFTYGIDSTGLVKIPSGCTISATSTTCGTILYVISPTKAAVLDTGSSSPKAQIADK